MKSPVAKVLLILVGVFGVLVTTAYDFFRPGPAEFGKMQFMGFIISVFLLMAGLKNAFHSRKRQLDTIMLCIYLLGMFYLVLTPPSHFSDPNRVPMPRSHFTDPNRVPMPHAHFPDPNKRFLKITAFLPGDFGINILGFFPLGYLLLSLFYPDEGRRLNRFLVVVLSGLVLSLFIEVAQYYIPGRTSSVNDIVANGIGGGVGALYCHLEAKIFSHQQEKVA